MGKVSPHYSMYFKFNASHSMGDRSQKHPHTFWCRLVIRRDSEGLVPFFEYERRISAFLEEYRGAYLNETEMFSHVSPTVENIASLFFITIGEMFMDEPNYTLELLELGDAPTRSVCVGNLVFLGDEFNAFGYDEVKAVVEATKKRQGKQW